MKYGVIADIHENPRNVDKAISALKSEGVDRLILNGDLASYQGSVSRTQGFIGYVLESVGKSGLESYIQPGSHESVDVYAPVIDVMKERYKNLHDMVLEKKVQEEDHHLIFISGSDVLCGGEYIFGLDFPSGYYFIDDNPLKVDLKACNFDIKNYFEFKDQGLLKRLFHYDNLQEIASLVTDPDKTILVSHVPREFQGFDCVDVAYFAESKDGIVPGVVLEQSIRSQFPGLDYDGVKSVALDNGFVFKTENRGNKGLKVFFEQLGISKGISNHFHESAHKANDKDSSRLVEDVFSDSFFYNSGSVDAFQTGVFTVENGKLKFKNINF